ncbi:MAG: hypothetical protein WDO68_05810 [Gammaproteobacteria bacterium]
MTRLSVASNRLVRPRLAIPVPALEKFLDEHRPLGRDAFRCDPPR